MPLPGATRMALRITLIVAGALAVLPGSAVALTPVQVAPGHGGSRTTFTISFRAPIDTTVDPFNESYEMGVKGPSRSACAGELSVYTSSGRGLRRGQLVHVRVRAPYRHARWCPGAYSGTINEFSVNPSSTCEQEQHLAACASGETLIGSFRFRVTA
jgi:hypothetical protein